MDKNVKEEIESFVIDEIEAIKSLDSNEENYYDKRGNIIKDISVLVELLQKDDANSINDNKIEKEYYLNLKKLESENKKVEEDIKLKKKELNMNSIRDVDASTDRVIKTVIDGAAILVPIIFYNVWMKRGFKFEETGTYTSNTFKNLFSKFRPTK